MNHRATQNVRRHPLARWSVSAVAATAVVALGLSGFGQVPQSASAEESVYDDTTVPQLITDPDPNSVELGVRFSSDVDIEVTGIRFFKGPENTGEHVGTLWSQSRKALATATFTDETESGWQEAQFDEPVPVAAGSRLVAS